MSPRTQQIRRQPFEALTHRKECLCDPVLLDRTRASTLVSKPGSSMGADVARIVLFVSNDPLVDNPALRLWRRGLAIAYCIVGMCRGRCSHVIIPKDP